MNCVCGCGDGNVFDHSEEGKTDVQFLAESELNRRSAERALAESERIREAHKVQIAALERKLAASQEALKSVQREVSRGLQKNGRDILATWIDEARLWQHAGYVAQPSAPTTVGPPTDYTWIDFE